MRVLITGVTGFVGTHLAKRLSAGARETELWGLVRPDSSTSAIRGTCPALRLVAADLGDADSLARAVRTARPETVFHLAAASPVASSWESPAHVFQTNAVGQIHLFEALRALEIPPRTVVACSGDGYGRIEPSDIPVTEASPLRPVSPYGVSKAAQDMLAGQYAAGFDLPVVRLRLFNHTGPGRPSRFVASSFARQLAEIEHGLRPPSLTVGNLDAVRDFTDVRDVTRAYELAAARGDAGQVYNVCSGRPTSIRQLLDILLSISGEGVRVTIDPHLSRPADIPVLVGDASRFSDATGWSPRIPLEQTLRDLLLWWRERVA